MPRSRLYANCGSARADRAQPRQRSASMSIPKTERASEGATTGAAIGGKRSAVVVQASAPLLCVSFLRRPRSAGSGQGPFALWRGFRPVDALHDLHGWPLRAPCCPVPAFRFAAPHSLRCPEPGSDPLSRRFPLPALVANAWRFPYIFRMSPVHVAICAAICAPVRAAVRAAVRAKKTLTKPSPFR